MSEEFDFKRTIYLGERVSRKHPFFMEISKLGFDDADNYAHLESMKALFPEWRDLLDGFQALIEPIGMASFLRNTKELTRLSLILGKTGHTVDAKATFLGGET